MSISNALALLAQGAAGRTYTQLVETLHSDRDKAYPAYQYHELRKTVETNVGEATLAMANRIYVQQGYQLSKTFADKAITKFGSGIEMINFVEAANSADVINNFVEEKTRGKISDLINPEQLDADTRSILVNAIYFNGNWEHPFKKEYTRKGDFYNSETKIVSIDFMHLDCEFNTAFIEGLNATALEMKYANSSVSFVILLPQSRTGLDALEVNLIEYDLTKLGDSLKLDRRDAYIPKFKVEYQMKLNEVLNNVSDHLL